MYNDRKCPKLSPDGCVPIDLILTAHFLGGKRKAEVLKENCDVEVPAEIVGPFGDGRVVPGVFAGLF